MELDLYILFIQLLMLVKIDVKVSANLVLTPPAGYAPNFNFHNKNAFLKDHIKKLINCIQPEPGNTDPVYDPLPITESLNLSSKGAQTVKKMRYIFDYVGKRKHNETCLGDTYKRDFIRRLYDAICMKYEEKIKFLDALSCNATQNLECRQVGVEPNRQFAEQATPIMRCLCPDYSKSQAYLPETSNAGGYFDKTREQCVLKTGQKCLINPKSLDARLVWNDFDYDGDNDGVAEGIDVVDLRPIALTYPCVDHAYCYTADHKEKEILELHRDRCVCGEGYFSGADRECHHGRDAPTTKGLWLAMLFFSLAVATFIGALIV